VSSRSIAITTSVPKKGHWNSSQISRVQALLGKPPLLEGEDPDQYEALAQQIYDALNLRDAIEAVQARDVVDLTWEILRLRRAKVHLQRSSENESLRLLIESRVSLWDKMVPGWDALGEGLARRDPAAVKEAKATLAGVGLDEEAIAAQTLRALLPVIETIENLIARAEARRHALLRELDRRRDVIERRQREMQEIESAHMKQLPSPGETDG
jgi:hypothetical protein